MLRTQVLGQKSMFMFVYNSVYGRKSLTTVQGLKKEYSYTKILKDLKKEFCCNGTVVQDPELGPGHTTPGRSKKECFYFPCAGGHSKEGA
ncbi:SUI1 domain [Sesbania bispinosa]|nr:SUI1 domain [Sesbania bispinosa]